MTYPFGPHGAPCPISLLLRCTAFDAVGGFPEEFQPATRQLFEDTAFLTKLYFSQSVYVASRCTDRYRCHPNSIWHRSMGTTDGEAERRFYFSWLRNYLHTSGIHDAAIWKAVRRQCWMYSIGLPDFITLHLRRTAEQLRRKLKPSPPHSA